MLPVMLVQMVASETVIPVVSSTVALSPSYEDVDNAGIHAAASRGEISRVDSLLADDPSLLEARDARGMTPLALAAWNDHAGLVEHLAALGADVDTRNDNGLTPLFCSIDRTRPTTARSLIISGADLGTVGYHGRSLLHMAARAGDTGLVGVLLESGADVNLHDVRGVTPADLAAWNGHQDVVELLSAHGGMRSGEGRGWIVRMYRAA
jgi:ankyrin repeat protein